VSYPSGEEYEWCVESKLIAVVSTVSQRRSRPLINYPSQFSQNITALDDFSAGPPVALEHLVVAVGRFAVVFGARARLEQFVAVFVEQRCAALDAGRRLAQLDRTARDGDGLVSPGLVDVRGETRW